VIPRGVRDVTDGGGAGVALVTAPVFGQSLQAPITMSAATVNIVRTYLRIVSLQFTSQTCFPPEAAIARIAFSQLRSHELLRVGDGFFA